jgi:hypothetical protein
VEIPITLKAILVNSRQPGDFFTRGNELHRYGNLGKLEEKH